MKSILKALERRDKGPLMNADSETMSMMNRATRECLQGHFINEAQGIIDRKAERIANFGKYADEFSDVPLAYLLAYENQEMLHSINMLRKAKSLIEQPPAMRPALFVMHEMFLRECAEAVEFKGREEAVIISGLDLGNVKVVTEMFDFDKDKTVVSIESVPEMIMPVMQKLGEMGMSFMGVFHSHPGGGMASPSTVDMATQKFLEQSYKPLGGIFTEDFVTFYTKDMEFRVHVMGNNVEHVQDNVWKLR